MIPLDERRTIHALFEKGIAKKKIARMLHLDPKTVRTVLQKDPQSTPARRRDKVRVDEQLLRDLYADCDGFAWRVYEKLTEEHDVQASYSTVLRLLREYRVGKPVAPRSERFEDIPGQEMQHDTSPHRVCINGKEHKLVCSGLYLRYSKMRYIKYFRRDTRFHMKCLIDEALRHWGYVAKVCIIDNTSLAIDYGTGKDAVFSTEMVRFAQNYGFCWYAHAVGHANRKAGKERNFYTVETNFLPGRRFSSLEDLNNQAREWATNRYANRPQSKTALIPSRLFQSERSSLQKLPEFIHPPSEQHNRVIDQYGYIAFNGNFYWVPDKQAGAVSIIAYANRIDVYDSMHNKIITHVLFDELTKRQFREPDPQQGKKTRRYKPNNRKNDSKEEQGILRRDGEVVSAYLDFVLSKQSGIAYRHLFIRNMFLLRKKTTQSLFIQAIQRALQYKVNHIGQIHNIFATILKKPLYEKPSSMISDNYKNRPEYRQGRFTIENDVDDTDSSDK